MSVVRYRSGTVFGTIDPYPDRSGVALYRLVEVNFVDGGADGVDRHQHQHFS